MFWKAKPEYQLSIKRCEVRNHDGAESRNILIFLSFGMEETD
jgi:hypothetical protein